MNDALIQYLNVYVDATDQMYMYLKLNYTLLSIQVK